MKKYLVVGALLLALTGVALTASAQTSPSIDQVIQYLQSHPDVLQRLLALINHNGGGAGGQFCYNFNTNLGVGSTGEDVGALVKVLGMDGEAAGLGGGPYNNFGEDSASLVVKFQAKYGIPQTGYVGPLTRAKLNSLYGCGVNPVPIPVPPQPNGLQVTSPNGGESWQRGSSQSIQWQSGPLPASFVYTSTATIKLLALD